jgi:uncharacterized protein (TIGR02265 family)
VTERLIFANSVEALFVRGVGSQLTPEIKDELRSIGIDLSKRLLPAYPSDVYYAAIALLVRRLYPGLPPSTAQFKLGERSVLGLEETFLGRSAVVLSKLIGTRRAILRFPVSAMATTNYAKLEARELSPTQVEVTICPMDGDVNFMSGCISALITMTGGHDGKTEVVEHDREKERLVLRVSWSVIAGKSL